MSDVAKLCEELLRCTQATLALIEGPDPQLNDISLQVQERASIFSRLSSPQQAPHSPSDARLLTQMAKTLQPLDAKILSWMQANQDTIAGTLRKLQSEKPRDPRNPSEARILIQDA